jgi:hypothetical protein
LGVFEEEESGRGPDRGCDETRVLAEKSVTTSPEEGRLGAEERQQGFLRARAGAAA